MPPIEIPDAYWTISPRGFVDLVGQAQPAILAVYSGLGGDVTDLQTANDTNVAPQLGDVDGDSWTLDQDTQMELANTQLPIIQGVVAQYPEADALHGAGDDAVAPVNAVGV